MKLRNRLDYKVVPGLTYLRLFAGLDTSSFDGVENTPDKTCCSFSRHGFLGYTVVGIFVAAFFLDVTDLFFQGTKRDVSYGISNGILVTIGFASSQVALFRVTVTSIFAVLNPNAVYRCMMNVLKVSERFKIPQRRFREHMRYGHIYFFVVEAMSLARLVLMGLEYQNIFFERIYYSFFRVSGGATATYLFCMIVIGNAVNYPLIMAHYFACSTVCDCADNILVEMENCSKDSAALKGSTTEFTFTLKAFSSRYGTLCTLFNNVEDVFSVKYLVDLCSGCILEFIVVIAFVATWATVPGTDGYHIGRMATQLVAALARLAIFTVKPFQLTGKVERFHDAIDTLLYNRQQARTSGSTSTEEYEASQTFERKIKTTSLTFTAAGVLPIDRSAVSTALFLFLGFFCFVLDRVENTNSEFMENVEYCACNRSYPNGTISTVTHASVQTFTV